MNFVQRNPTEPQPKILPEEHRFHGYLVAGRNFTFIDTWHNLIANDISLGPDGLPGRAGIDDDGNGRMDIEDPDEAGPPRGDDASLGTYTFVSDFLLGLVG